MSKKLSIIVAGDNNTGKSTMLYQLEKLLKENGFNVELSFEHHPDYSGENSFYFHQKEGNNFNEKIEALKQDLVITLKETKTDFDTNQNKERIKNPYC